MPTKRTHPNLRQIDVSYNENYVRGSGLKFYAEVSKQIFSATLQHKNVQELLTDTKQQFDLVVAEWMSNEMAIGLAALYNCPLIWFSALVNYWSILQQIQETANRYTSTSVSKNYYYHSTYMMKEAYLDSFDKEAFNRIFGPLMALKGKSLPSHTEIMHLCSMVFVYSPVLLGDASKWPQNFKPVGGYHISPKVKQLPENIQSIMDNAKHGVIYFSLGSHLRSEILSEKLKKDLLKMFSKLKQTILWKDGSAFSNLTSNVYFMEWFPQQSVLSHPNCALFITQGGMLSMTEAVYYAVPVIGIPIFGDQFSNVQKAVESGIARKVLPSPIMAEEIKSAIEEMLQDPSYRKKIKEQSSIYHNRPTPIRVEVVNWVNQVIDKGVKKFEPKISFFSKAHTVVIVVIVIIVLKYMLRWSMYFLSVFNRNCKDD